MSLVINEFLAWTSQSYMFVFDCSDVCLERMWEYMFVFDCSDVCLDCMWEYMFVFDCSDVCLHCMWERGKAKVLEPLHLQSPELEMGVFLYNLWTLMFMYWT
jgi:predicted small metal-binding protein